ncbi:fat storage-inducing transmembrane protein 2-like [Actinia tenebrosa]|uniref:Fat storage-inducing transmembrane protein 2-like n=1 Tax=Actinia tenebrosa TaxID=6105 RepID=A0A6P8I3N8_ACTTE|nr:fat storage-inducing transmembrane protein 2-like [Actinia tenebrosa]
MADETSEEKPVHEKLLQFLKSTYSALRTIALTKTTYKVAIYWLIVVLGSFIHEFFPPPRSYFSYTKNVFNVYFVKLGWGWTWTLLSVLVLTTSAILTSGNVILIASHYSRLIVATIAWFLWVNFFEYVEHISGSCKGESRHGSKYTCHKHGYFWEGFDVSGHTFLLIHCCLTISEEIKVVKLIEDLDKGIDNHGNPSTGPMSFKSKYWYKLFSPFINTTFLFTAILMVLWEIMLVSTCVNFHTTLQKIFGALPAFITWKFNYQYWHMQDSGVVLSAQSYFNNYDFRQ